MKKTQGIVLSELRYRDTSKILTIYTRELGKVSVMAQGAYRPKSRLLANTQPFSYNEFQFSKGKNFYYINQADIIDTFYDIRNKMERIVFGFFMLELIDKSIVEEEENERIFILLLKGLNILSKLDKDYLKFIISYELKYISFLGYRPQISSCVNCNQTNSIRSFSISQGGLLCSSCFHLDNNPRQITMEQVDLMNKLLYTSMDKLGEIKADNKILIPINRLIIDYILYNIDRKEFKSLKLLNSSFE